MSHDAHIWNDSHSAHVAVPDESHVMPTMGKLTVYSYINGPYGSHMVSHKISIRDFTEITMAHMGPGTISYGALINLGCNIK